MQTIRDGPSAVRTDALARLAGAACAISGVGVALVLVGDGYSSRRASG
ncbi:hypothetical protein [Streptomyces sp. SLBN-118]|nr:hypothetical protein [Streptomyces sp. SLBN-118]